ncbi:hypothetical protein X551_04787 [Methylibium sp. T29]|nr:hypothetical protein X551_04787 [Methylibium sp. T29]EWS57193.1 hypothetical protein Y694_04734 [Methylibium sp. T29-B]
MRRVGVAEQAIVQRGCAGRRAVAGVVQQRVHAVGLAVQRQARQRAQVAASVVQAQPVGHVAGDVGLARSHLAPAQLAIGVGVELEHGVEVAQRHVDLQCQLAVRIDAGAQVGVAGLVG